LPWQLLPSLYFHVLATKVVDVVAIEAADFQIYLSQQCYLVLAETVAIGATSVAVLVASADLGEEVPVAVVPVAIGNKS
jgi:hypothetical protein